MQFRAGLLRLIALRAPEGLCDACLADHLATSVRRVSGAARSIARQERYRRFAGRCSGCCTTRVLTAQAFG